MGQSLVTSLFSGGGNSSAKAKNARTSPPQRLKKASNTPSSESRRVALDGSANSKRIVAFATTPKSSSKGGGRSSQRSSKYSCSPGERSTVVSASQASADSYSTPMKQLQSRGNSCASDATGSSGSSTAGFENTLPTELRAHLPPTPANDYTPIYASPEGVEEYLTTTAKKAAASPSAAKVLMWATPAARLAKILNDEGSNIFHLLDMEKKQATSLEQVLEMNRSFSQANALETVSHIHMICTQFYMRQQTFHLAAALVMRILANEKAGTKKESKLLNYVCVLIASKLEEEQLKYDADDVAKACKVKVSKVCERERIVSEILHFRLSIVTQGSLLETFYNIAHFNTKQQQWSSLFADVSTFYISLSLQYPSSQLAAAAVLLTSMLTSALDDKLVKGGSTARKKKTRASTKSPSQTPVVLKRHWPLALEKATGYTHAKLVPVARAIIDVVEQSLTECDGLWRRYNAPANGRLLKIAKGTDWDECRTPAGVAFF